jgi:predicted secreted protein
MKKTLTLSGYLVLLLILASCASTEINHESPEINIVNAGKKFTVRLPEDHRTGYIWQMTDSYDEQVVKRLNEVWHGNEKGIYFNLQALSAGQTTLTFVNRKYTDTSDLKRFIVKIADN